MELNELCSSVYVLSYILKSHHNQSHFWAIAEQLFVNICAKYRVYDHEFGVNFMNSLLIERTMRIT